MEKQTDFEFADVGNAGRRVEPPRKVKVRRESSSLCAYCGQRMPSALLDSTPPLGDNRWTAAAPYHAPSCTWIATQGLRIDEGSHP
jgi:hypothetical protein